MAPKRNYAMSTPSKRGRTTSSLRKPARRNTRVSRVARPLSMPKGMAFPERLSNTLKYAETVDLTLSGAGGANYAFRCNGIYDPNSTGTGHQPLYYDDLTSIYDHWTVVSSTIKVTQAINEASTNTTPFTYMFNLYQDDDATTLNGQQEYWDAKSTAVTLWASDPKPRFLRFNGAATYGGNLIDNSLLQGAGGSDPLELSYFVLQFFDGPGLQPIRFYVEISYDVVWHELKSQVRS